MERETSALIDFIDRSPSPYHAVANAKAMLRGAGFEELDERRRFSIKEGGSYFVERNGSALIAFRIPEGASAFSIVAAHTDSPVLHIKPDPENVSSGLYTTLNAEIYGGMLAQPWFDRPLSVAGRVFVRKGNEISCHLVDIGRDLLMIPSLAIHMDRKANEEGLRSVQKELQPLFAEGSAKGGLRKLIADTLSIDEDAIIDSDLIVYDRMKGTVWGKDGEFFSAPRIDDLGCAFSAIGALCETGSGKTMQIAALFDNEEIGSSTRQGALSDFLAATLRRITLSLGMDEEEHMIATASSFMLSADNGHAVHPNYAEKADVTSRPRLNGGVLLKYSGNGKYTTDGRSGSLVRSLMDKNGIPYQIFANNSDIPGGSTLGNLSMQEISIETADVGMAQLAMHSPYESAGARDPKALKSLFKVFFER